MKNRQRNRLDATESSKNLSELCALITLWAVAKCPFFSRLILLYRHYIYSSQHSSLSIQIQARHLRRGLILQAGV